MNKSEMPSFDPENRFRPLDELPEFELEGDDPTGYMVIGAGDFVLGRVRRLLVDLATREVCYLVVNTTVSNFGADKGEERLVPLAWAELVGVRRQARMAHLPSYRFRRLPLYQAEAPVPSEVEFPRPRPEDPDWLEIA